MAEFVFALNNYNDYVWNFGYYFYEYKKQAEINRLWQVYMTRVCSAGLKDFPQFYDLIKDFGGVGKKKETPQQAVNRLIEKVNKSNGGV